MNGATYRPATVAQAFERIRAGLDPRIALGDLLDDWRRTSPQDRPRLVADPIGDPGSDLKLRRWAAFLAATVEKLCWDEPGGRISPPAWTARPQHRLAEPWFLEPAAPLRAWLLATTPAAFLSRNIFCGTDLFRRA